ncbi:alkaline phosphatase family protein [Frondihabitans peucedani]|uniref:Phosphodiesterase n=1 Tax=Frondihabitans peucedani TaxID=598626 RepID=A0ABP8E502_9MICO
MTSRKLLLVGIDGLRIDDALADGSAPSLASLIAHGRLHQVEMEVPTISGPGWSSILTGTRHEVHGVFDNTFSGNRLDRTVDLLTRAARADPARSTFAASSWPPLLDPRGPGPVVATRHDDQRVGRHRLVVRDGETYGYREADGDVAAFARLAIRAAGPDASFVYLGEVDEAGHLYGGRSPEYTRASERVDGLLGGILHEVERRAQDHAEDWLVGVTTDHGHLDEGGHGGDDAVLTRSFLALRRYGPEEIAPVAAEAVRPGEIRPEEIAALLLAHLD